MSQIKVGDIVKSLDFNGVDDCYMIGIVIGFHEMGTFRAKFIKRVWEGVEDCKFKTDFFWAPLQGQQMFDKPESPRVLVIG